MVNVRRFPGVLYRYKGRCGGVAAVVFFLIYLLHRWGYVCTNSEVRHEIVKLCRLYEEGEAVGNLCHPLCLDKQIHSISCVSTHSRQQISFVAKWNEDLVVIKSAPALAIERLKSPGEPETPRETGNVSGAKTRGKAMENTLELYPGHLMTPKKADEKGMERKIANLVGERLNMSLTREQLDSLMYLELNNKFLYSDTTEKRIAEKNNILTLLQSQEYLIFRLFAEKDVFPRVLGTCGHFYGVEYLEASSFDSVFTLDDKAEWSDRMKLAIAILDLVEIVETEFPDALYFCDVQMSHFGVTKSGRVKFLDANFVFPKGVLDRMLKTGRKCGAHRDCDLLDCRSNCNENKLVCDAGVANDNLQAICEKIFIGWTLSGKIIVPGLLMSENTPASLSTQLRLCAENRRRAVPEDLRRRLYTILAEMHQILVQRLLDP